MATGTYVKFDVAAMCAAELQMLFNKIPGQRIDGQNMHCTLFSSCDAIIPADVIRGLGILSVPTFQTVGCKFLGLNAIVLIIELSDEVRTMRNTLEGLGFKHKFPDYTFHVSLAYDCPEGTELPDIPDGGWPPVTLDPTPVAEPFVDNWRPVSE